MKTILVVAAHPDDEILGCGGTIARYAESGNKIHILIMAEGITSRDDHRNREARSTELTKLATVANLANKHLGADSVELLDFPDNRMDSVSLLDITKKVENKISALHPDTIFTHHPGDVNIDHLMVHKAVVTATRPFPDQLVNTLLFFEVPSSTEWQVPDGTKGFIPNWFENISDTGADGKTYLQKKLDALSIYDSEMRNFPHPRSIAAVEHLAKWRGANIGFNAAEGFSLGRIIR